LAILLVMTIAGPDEAIAPPPQDDRATDAALRGCPFLLAESGGWRLDTPSKQHRCAAVSPAAALSTEKQARLCLTAAHVGCATYVASMSARGSRLGTPAGEHATRWGLARTTAVIEDAGGVRTRVVGTLTDRRRWPAVPAVLLLVGLIVLGLSGINGFPAASTASPSPARSLPVATTGATPTAATSTPAEPTPSVEPSSAPTAAPTASAAPTGTPGPSASFRTYTVRSGDTLSGIATKFGTTAKAIAALNGISVSTTLHAGQVLKIPN
jgi:LysM repeat protein